MRGPADFEKAMYQIYVRAKKEAGYNATIYQRMLQDRGGLATAKTLINAPKVSAGYAHLYERGRLDLTVEALVVENAQWHALFTPDEIEKARKRLLEYEYRGTQ